MIKVEKWSVFEVEIKGKSDGNPFVDYTISAVFEGENETVKVNGFYDGDGIYRVRFMPSYEGEYNYSVSGTFADEVSNGTFVVTKAKGDNHGPVHVADKYHFAYADGKPYYQVGTTAYVWTHQDLELQEKTLETLSKGYFNKIRFCVFPKHYVFNFREPQTYPYVGTPMDNSVLTKDNFWSYLENHEGNNWDFYRFNPEHFQKFEKRIVDLMKMGIEADIIVMHPYDRWGFSNMPADADDLYWNYVINRFGAYRNVWWSLANEFDLLHNKTVEDWEKYARILCEKDPYNHPRSIHNCGGFYDHTKSWITHCSLQRQELQKTTEFTKDYLELYQKPIVWDEISYEGNTDACWGNISGQELVRRFWEATVRGGYAGHGETYYHPQDILWWSHGGELHGTSPERIKFLHEILCQTPGLGLQAYSMKTSDIGFKLQWDDVMAYPATKEFERDYFLFYFGIFRPSFREYHFDDVNEYDVEIIDTWEMTITKAGRFKGKFNIALPGKEYIALRIIKVK